MVIGELSILFCGNGLSGEIIKALKAQGLNIHVITEFPNDIGLEYADNVVKSNSKSVPEALSAADFLNRKGVTFDGVLSLCWDCALSVSAIAEKYSLFAVSKETACFTTMKDTRSKQFQAHSVPAPNFCLVDNYKDLLKAVEQNLSLPIVVKPKDLSSSKGVTMVDSLSELLPAFEYARSFSAENILIVNEYIVGSEHSTEGLMIDGKFYPTAISDRIFDYEKNRPHFVEIGDVMPTILNEQQITSAYKATEKAALSVGLKNGVAKGDLIHDPNRGVFVLEIAARLGGPRFGTEMVPLSNGSNILRAAIHQAAGLEIDMDDLEQKYAKGMVNRSIFPKPGRVVSIQGLERIRNLPGFYDFKWWSPEGLKVGDVIKPYENSGGDVGYLIATGEDRKEAIINADNIEQSIVIETV